MKPRPGLPCGVRLTVGLGGAGGTTALALMAETVTESERRDTVSVEVVFTAGSVPELSLLRHRLGEPTWRCISSYRCARSRPGTTPTLRATFGAVLCRWRAARRRTGSHHKACALAPRRASDGAGNSGGGSVQRRTSGTRLGAERQTSGVDQRYSPCKERR